MAVDGPGDDRLTVAALAEQLAELRADNLRLQDRVRDLEHLLRRRDTGPVTAATDVGLVGRRQLLGKLGMAAAGVGALAVGATAVDASPAAAANGNPVVLGKSNSATTATVVVAGAKSGIVRGAALWGDTNAAGAAGLSGTTSGSSAAGVLGTAGSATGLSSSVGAAGVWGDSGTGVGVAGTTTSPNSGVYGIQGGPSGVPGGYSITGAGVWGDSHDGFGVMGSSYGSDGVRAISRNGVGVAASSITQAGVSASSSSSAGVYATSSSGDGVDGISYGSGSGVQGYSNNGSGVRGESASGNAFDGISSSGYGASLSGGLAPLRLAPSPITSTPGPPTTNSHLLGELYVDAQGILWYCAASGSPGTWGRLVVAPSAGGGGSMNILAQPTRLYDTRGGDAPFPATPGPLGPGSSYTLQAAGVAVPVGAVAVIGTLTVTNTGSSGYLSTFASGTPSPVVVSIAWSAAGETVATQVTIPLTTSGTCVIANGLGGGSTPTDVIFDALAYVF